MALYSAFWTAAAEERLVAGASGFTVRYRGQDLLVRVVPPGPDKGCRALVRSRGSGRPLRSAISSTFAARSHDRRLRVGVPVAGLVGGLGLGLSSLLLRPGVVCAFLGLVPVPVTHVRFLAIQRTS